MFLAGAPAVEAAIPTFVNCGTASGSTGAITLSLPTGIAADDILLMFLETDAQTISVANGNGGTWAEVANSPQTAGANTRLTVFWSRYNGTQGNPVTSDSGNHQVGSICAYRGVVTAGDPWDVTSGGVDTTSDTSGSIPGATTTGPDRLIIIVGAADDDADTPITVVSNPDLASISAARVNAESGQGNDGGLTVFDGQKAAAGSYGTTTLTYTSATTKGMMTIALKPPVTTIGDGTNPGNSSIAPGASATDIDTFTLQTDAGIDTVTAATVTLASGSSGGLSLVAITNNAGSATYCSQSDPSSDAVSLSSCSIPVTTTLTSFKVRITPKTHANMPAPQGSTYAVTGTVTSFTSANSQSGSDTDSATVTIDNASPANVTSASGSAGNTQVSLSWTNPADGDLHGTVVLRSTNAVADTPVEGTTYTIGNTIGTAAVACVVASPSNSCTDMGLTNGTAYHYKIFSRDTNANYSTGAVPSGSPITPADASAPGAVTNLAITSAGQTSVVLTWTAPGDDGDSGTASSYDMRYSTSAITAGNFSSATAATGEPTPSAASSSESMTVSGLSASTLYYFAVKTSDEAPNTSVISNAVSTTTSAVADTTPPADVANLTITSVGQTSVSLSWTAPGDDNNSGTAASYDMRYSTSAITAGNFGSATQATGEPAPSAAGSSESMTVSGLSASTLYYFASKTSDEAPNTSNISNVVSTTTLAAADTAAPGAVTNLAVSTVSSSSVGLTWAAPGDDGDSGTATTYDVRYSTSAITAGNFSSATAATGEPTPSAASSSESMTVSGLSASTLYYFAVKTSDEAPNTSAISNTVSTTTSAVSAPEPEPTPVPEAAPQRISTTGRKIGVFFSGQAYPNSKIEVLRKDTSAVGVSYLTMPLEVYKVSDSGIFDLSPGALIVDEYFFVLRAEDKDGRKTRILPFSVDLRITDKLEVRDILMPPTLDFDRTRIRRGDSIKIIGYSTPGNKTEIEIDDKIVSVVSPQKTGFYSFVTTTAKFSFGNHYAKARQVNSKGKESNFSAARTFQISQLLVPRADFNRDNVVNVTDWSIFLFRWGSKDEKIKAAADMNADGKVDIKDFSIFLGTMSF